MTDELLDRYDVVVIGGGVAGLNGALLLGRSRRSVAVIDAGHPRNAPAAGVHGVLGLEGITPAALLDRGRAEVRSYGVHVISGEVTGAARLADGSLGDLAQEFTVALADGRSTRARRLLVTTGLFDQLPEIEGLRERWGHDVLHCPYCHGWEVRDRAIGVLATGPMSTHHALMFRQLSDDIVFFVRDAPPDTEQTALLRARGITLVEAAVTGLEVTDDRLTGVRLDDGSVVPREVIAVGTRMVARTAVLAGLGLHPVPHPSGMGDHLQTDASGRTGVPGVWAAGNVADLGANVGISAASGGCAAAQINAELVIAEAQAALAARAEPSLIGLSPR